MLAFDGTVAYQNLERGFFAIDADDGHKYTPVNLPKDFAVAGLRVRVAARRRDDLAGISMYGALVEIVEISILAPQAPP